MDSMKSLNISSSKCHPIWCLLGLISLATLTVGVNTGVNSFSEFSQPVGPFGVVTEAEDDIVVRLPVSHSSERNFGGEAPRAQQNFGIPLTVSLQNSVSAPAGGHSAIRDSAGQAQVTGQSPRFFVLGEENGNGNGNGAAVSPAVRSHFVAPGTQQRGIPLNAFNQVNSQSSAPSTPVNNARGAQPASRFFVVQEDGEVENGNVHFNARTNFGRTNGFTANVIADSQSHGVPLNFASQDTGLNGQRSPNSVGPATNNARTSAPAPTFFVLDAENSFEELGGLEDNFSNNVAMSLGRRFHPNGIPIRSNPVEAPRTSQSSQTSPASEVKSPFLLTPNSLFVLNDASVEDELDDDFEKKIVVNLSPMVKAHNHDTSNERLSLSHDFLNQYNFVDVTGSTSFGYKTEDQYQDHTVHRSGKHEGKFGWTAPEGSKHHFEYIADEKGYRIITSSGQYLNDDPNVKAAKDNHFNEHRKALENIETTRRRHEQNTAAAQSVHPSSFGVPLPESGVSPALSSSQPGFVVIESDDDIPLFTDLSGTQGPTLHSATSQGSGRPLPSGISPAGATKLDRPSPTGTTFGIPIPSVGSSDSPHTPSQGGTQFGVSLQDPEDIIVPVRYPADTLGGSIGFVDSPALGIPIPAAPPRAEGRPGAPAQQTPSRDSSAFGIPIPGMPSRGTGQAIAPTQQTPDQASSSFGIPIPGIPSIAIGQPIEPTQQTHDQGTSAFGIPISGIPARFDGKPAAEPTLQTLSNGGQQIGIVHLDPENIVVPVQYSENAFGGLGGASQQPSGGAFGSTSFGIPIPDVPTRADIKPVASAKPAPAQDQGFGEASAQTPTFGIPIPEVPVTPPKPAQGPTFGISFPETPTRADSKPVAPTRPASDQGLTFGIPLGQATAGADSEPITPPRPAPAQGPTFGIPIGQASTGADSLPVIPPRPAPAPTFGIPIPQAPPGADSKPVAPPRPAPAQGPTFGIPFPEAPASVESQPLTPPQEAPSLSFGIKTPDTFGIPIPEVPVREEGHPVYPQKQAPAFGISNPDVPLKAEGKPIAPTSQTPAQSGNKFGISPQTPEQIVEPVQYSEDTFEEAPAFGITPIRSGDEPASPSNQAFPKDAPTPVDMAFSEIFGPPAQKVPAAVSIQSPKLSVKTGDNHGVGLPLITGTSSKEPTTGIGGFTIITEDRPLVALNQVQDETGAQRGNKISVDTSKSTSKTFSNQFFVVSPGGGVNNANNGIGLFPKEPTNHGEPSDLLQGPPFANNETKNLIRRS